MVIIINNSPNTHLILFMASIGTTPSKDFLSEPYIEARIHAKTMFRQGKILEAFDFIQTKLQSLATADVSEEKEHAQAEVLNALILEARLRQEVG